MATNPFLTNGWNYNAELNGYVRPDTTWNSATRTWSSPNNVGGTIFMPNTAIASGGVSSLTRSATAAAPSLPAIRPPTTIMPSTVGTPSPVSANPVRLTNASWQAPDGSAFGVADVLARDVDPLMVDDPALLQELDRQAQADLALGGSLSAQETRDAQQSARAAFGARGMLMGNPAVAAEILARDQFSRQRLGERRQFAQGVAGMLSGIDLANQQAGNTVALANADARLRALLANQGVRAGQWTTAAEGTLRTALQNASEANRVALGNEQNRLTAATSNQDFQLRASLANQQAQMQANQWNASNALDYARMGIEGTLGAFNAGTNRMNALTGQTTAANSLFTSLLAGTTANRNASDYLAGYNNGGVSTAVSTYRPIGTWGTTTAGYRAL